MHTRNSTVEEFQFPRPESAEEIEALFEQVKSQRDLGPLNDLTLDQKWLIVYNDEQLRWREERQRAAQQAKRPSAGQIAPMTFSKDSPEWYLKKFMDMSVTPKHVASLAVSLRTMPIRHASHRRAGSGG